MARGLAAEKIPQKEDVGLTREMAEAGRRELEEFIETGSGLLCSSTFVASEVYRAMELVRRLGQRTPRAPGN